MLKALPTFTTEPPRRTLRQCRIFLIALALFEVLALFETIASPRLAASELDDVRNHMRTGQYEDAIELAKSQVDKRVWNELWPRMLVEAYLVTGQYSKALEVYDAALDRYGDSIRLRMLGVQVHRMNNQLKQANEELTLIETMVQRSPWRFTNKSE